MELVYVLLGILFSSFLSTYRLHCNRCFYAGCHICTSYTWGRFLRYFLLL